MFERLSFLKKPLILFFTAFHLCVIASGIIPQPVITSQAFFDMKKYYQMFTAAGASFGFFSPNIPNQFLVRYEIEPGHRQVSLSELVSAEVALRVGNMNRFFAYQYDKKDHRRSIAASLTLPIFERFPDADSVTFVSEMILLPTLTEHNNGSKASNKEIYRATFTLPSKSHDSI